MHKMQGDTVKYSGFIECLDLRCDKQYDYFARR
nr:MAG TPA: hypothetical protein [Caudoviricetes sp.]